LERDLHLKYLLIAFPFVEVVLGTLKRITETIAKNVDVHNQSFGHILNLDENVII
jgi:hypothetical protein